MDSSVLDGTSEEDGRELASDSGATDSFDKVRRGDGLFGKVEVCDGVVYVGEGFDEFLTLLGG